MAQFDRNKFNTDPKLQEQRDFLDGLVEDAAKRILDKQKKEKPNEKSILEDFFSFLNPEDK